MEDADERSLARTMLDARGRNFRRARNYALVTLLLLAVMALAALVDNFPCIGCAAAPAPTASCPAGLVCSSASPSAGITGSTLPSTVVILSALGSIVSALATVSSVILAWRKDRREVAEFRRRLDELEAARGRS